MIPCAKFSDPPPLEFVDTRTSSCDLQAAYDSWLCGDPSDDSRGMLGDIPISSVHFSPLCVQPSETSSLDSAEAEGLGNVVPHSPRTNASPNSPYPDTLCTIVASASQPPSSFQDDYRHVNQDDPNSLPLHLPDRRIHHHAEVRPPPCSPPSCEVHAQGRFSAAPLDPVPNVMNTSTVLPGTAARTSSPESLVSPPLPCADSQPASYPTPCLNSTPPPSPHAALQAYLLFVAQSQSAHPSLRRIVEDLEHAKERITRKLSEVEHVLAGRTDSKFSRRRAQARGESCSPSESSPLRGGSSGSHCSPSLYAPWWCASRCGTADYQPPSPFSVFPSSPLALERGRPEPQSSGRCRVTGSPQPTPGLCKLSQSGDSDSDADYAGAGAVIGCWEQTVWHGVFCQMDRDLSRRLIRS